MTSELILERGDPVIVQYRRRMALLPVKLFVFGHQDDRFIPEGKTVSILTCSRESYPELRPYFAQAFTSFVTRINQGKNGGYGMWNDYLCNPHNGHFREILVGGLGPETELFIIPMQRSKLRRFIPTGGVNYVVKAYMDHSGGMNGKLNLVCGDTRIRYDGLFLDRYLKETD